MDVVDFKYLPGTIEAPQNTESTEARWSETDKVHFPDGNVTPIPSFSQSSPSAGSLPMSGACRAQWAGRLGGSTTIAGAHYLFGTHSHLFAEYKATRYNITPFAGQKKETLGDDPLDATDTDETLEVEIIAHGLDVGDLITISGAADVGGIDADTYINTQHEVASVVSANAVSIELGTAATSTEAGGGNFVVALTLAAADGLSSAIDTTAASNVLTVNYTAHGLSSNDRIQLSGFTVSDGVPAAEINAEHIITVVDVDSFTITVSTSATSGATGEGGAGGRIYTQVAAGNENQSFKSGYGAGLYNRGSYNTNRVSASTPSFPRISSFDNYGNKFLYCPGDYDAGDGQKIYEWDGDHSVAPTPFLDAPDNCNWIAVIANQVVALCGTNIVIALTDPTTGKALWPEIPSSSPIGDVIPVQRATRLLSIAPLGEKSAIVFAPEPLLLRLVGGVWDLIELGSEFPIVSPAAFCRFQDGVTWYGQDGNYYFCNGGSVRKLVNRQNGEYVRGRLNEDAIWTTFLMQDQKHDQFWHYYPSSGELNPDSYVVFNPLSESYTTGGQERTAAQRPSVVDQRFYTSDGDMIYNSFTTDDTSFEWSAKTAFFFLDPAYRWKIIRLMPDSILDGTVDIKILGKEHPQDTEIDYGTYTMDSSTTSMTVRGAGRLIALEFSGNSNFTLPNLKLGVQRMGRRRL